ncbi:MAG: DUF5663 domain-containing protein [Candidatus Saccharibacteria bacterium]
MITKEEIIQKLGIENLPPDEQEVQLQQLADTVATRVMQKITEMLSDEDIDKLNSLIDSGQDDQVEEFIRSKVDNYEQWNAQIELDTINELENNRKAVLAEADAIQNISTPTD